MFHLLKFLIWLAGIALVIYIALPYFGYEVNLGYFNQSKATCQKRLDQCTQSLIQQGTKNVKCDIMCVNPALIIKKQ